MSAEARSAAERELRRFCGTKVPASIRSEIRLEYDWRGDAATLYECRAPWRAEDTAWSRRPVAQLRHDAASRRWSLYGRRANGRWLCYDPAGGPSDLRGLIAWSRRDPDGVFWG